MNENIQKIITFSLVDLLKDDIDSLYLKQKEKEKKKGDIDSKGSNFPL